MKRLLTLLLTLTLTTAIAAMAADYDFGTGGDTLGGFGTATSSDAGRASKVLKQETVKKPMVYNQRNNNNMN